MKHRDVSWLLKWVALAVLFTAWPLAPRFFAASSVQTATVAGRHIDSFPPLLADIDGDHRIDHATLSSNGSRKTIHVALGRLSWRSLSFQSSDPYRGQLRDGDVDDDGDLDLIWLSDIGGNPVVWFGDGRGEFSIAADGTRLAAILRWLDSARAVVSSENDSACAATFPDAAFALPSSPRCGAPLVRPGIFAATEPQDDSLLFAPAFKPRGPPSRVS